MRSRARRYPLVVLTLAAATPALAGGTTTRYHVVDLGVAAGASDVCPCFFSQAMNESGQIAGFFFGTDGTYNAFRGDASGVVDVSMPGENRAFGRGINDLSWVVGWTDVFGIQHAFLHDGTTMIDLGTLGGTYSDANDINGAGQVVGCASTPFPDDDQHAAIWQDGTWTDLGTLGGVFSEATAINEGGMIVGWAWNDAWDRRPVFWNPDLSGPFELPTFSTPERHAVANDVNATGVIVGSVEIEPDAGLPRWRAALWQDGAVLDLGVLAEAGEGISLYGGPAHLTTTAAAINDHGIVVGLSSPPAGTPAFRPGPFVHRDGAMTNLNDLLVVASAEWIITDATDVNNAGEIAATARTADDNHARAVRLVPVQVPLGDLTGDGSVGFADLLAMLAAWGPCPGCPADLDASGVVGFPDLLMLLGVWGTTG